MLWVDVVVWLARAVVIIGELFWVAVFGVSIETWVCLGLYVVNLYKGLRAFDEGDVVDFFGWVIDVDELVELVVTRWFVVVVGLLGVGKSFLVRVGLVLVLWVGGVWVVVVVFGIYLVEEIVEVLLQVVLVVLVWLWECLVVFGGFVEVVIEIWGDDFGDFVFVFD